LINELKGDIMQAKEEKNETFAEMMFRKFGQSPTPVGELARMLQRNGGKMPRNAFLRLREVRCESVHAAHSQRSIKFGV
jgi:ribosomal protein L44E